MHRGMTTLYLRRWQRLGVDGAVERTIRRLTQNGLATDRELLEPLTEVDAVTDQRILEPLVRSQERRSHVAAAATWKGTAFLSFDPWKEKA